MIERHPESQRKRHSDSRTEIERKRNTSRESGRETHVREPEKETVR